jgi:hypothetical protein
MTTTDYIIATMTVVVWREERLCKVGVLIIMEQLMARHYRAKFSLR